MVPSMTHGKKVGGPSMGMRESIDGPWMGCPRIPTRAQFRMQEVRVRNLHGQSCFETNVAMLDYFIQLMFTCILRRPRIAQHSKTVLPKYMKF